MFSTVEELPEALITGAGLDGAGGGVPVAAELAVAATIAGARPLVPAVPFLPESLFFTDP